VSARRGLLPIAGFFGTVGTLFFYVALLIVQNENADYACESLELFPASKSGTCVVSALRTPT
jgi:hypothetical protein